MSIFPSIEFQHRQLPRHREPSSLLAREVCPHCKRELAEYRFCADGVLISTWSCAEHGDVQPMKSAVSNPATAHRAHPYHGVAIRYDSNPACAAVQQFALQSNLSDQAPPFLETRRFVSSEAPRLPLAGCTEQACRCRYVHYEDRRERDRRHAYSQSIASAPAAVERERRSGLNRRQS